MREDVIARRQRLEDRHACSRPGSERGRPCAALQRADSLFECLAVWIVVARIHEPARVGALGVSLERC